MSNDDRDAPRWGERLPHPEGNPSGAEQRDDAASAEPGQDAEQRYGQPQADEPRYGERHPAGEQQDRQQQYGEQQYGEQQYGGQQYGSQQQYGQRPYGQSPQGQEQYGQQQYGQSQYGQSPYGQQPYGQQHGDHDPYGAQQWQPPASQPYGQPGHTGAAWATAGSGARPSRRIGVIALVAAVVALVLGIVGGVVFGQGLTHIPGFAQAIRGGGMVDQGQLQRRMQEDPSALSGLATGGLLALLGTGFGIWAIVQGIIAIAKDRGRVFGIVALVVAVLGAIAWGATYTIILEGAAH